MQEYIRKRVLDIGTYILESSATVRQTADVFGVSKSTVQKDLSIRVGCFGCLNLLHKMMKRHYLHENR